MQIIPAMDLRNSKCVRLLQGRYECETIYSMDPLEVVEKFWQEGARSLHCVDLEGARQGRFLESELLKKILANRSFALQLGGGIRTLEQAGELLSLGVQTLVIGTLAIRSPEMVSGWLRELGAKHFCIGLDLKQGALSTEGWTSQSSTSLDSLVRFYQDLGVQQYLCTDISCDGTLAGPNLDLYQDLVVQFPDVEWTASGGVGDLNDLKKLSATGVSRVVVGKAFYEGRFSYEQACEALKC